MIQNVYLFSRFNTQLFKAHSFFKMHGFVKSQTLETKQKLAQLGVGEDVGLCLSASLFSFLGSFPQGIVLETIYDGSCIMYRAAW